MTLVGLVRVSTGKQETRRQRDALDPICVKVFEEKVSRTLSVDPARVAADVAAVLEERPGLRKDAPAFGPPRAPEATIRRRRPRRGNRCSSNFERRSL
ncbi:hypothetical protein [Rhodococcus globerulus]|uniref:hypothetical protein n=1 Tax=Rhodococcus globerulus TaxID=33008 RepID=UPI000ABE41A1|nr:hypothetical protein [Rhodococcus globerulus]